MAAKLKVKADKELFDEWNMLVERVRNMNYIVQNDMEMSREELVHWVNGVNETVNDWLNLVERVMVQIREGN